jgi:hypothetical protein
MHSKSAKEMVPKLKSLGSMCKKESQDKGYRVKLELLKTKWLVEMLFLWEDILLGVVLYHWLRIHQSKRTTTSTME